MRDVKVEARVEPMQLPMGVHGCKMATELSLPTQMGTCNRSVLDKISEPHDGALDTEEMEVEMENEMET